MGLRVSVWGGVLALVLGGYSSVVSSAVIHTSDICECISILGFSRQDRVPPDPGLTLSGQWR